MTSTTPLDAPHKDPTAPLIGDGAAAGQLSEASDPGSEETLIALLRQRKFDAARIQATAMAMANPADPLPHKALGAIAYQTDDHAEAVRQFSAALDLRPTEAESRVNLVKSLLKSGADDAGLAALRRAAASEGEALSADQLHQEALALAACCAPAEACERLLDAAELAPGELKHFELYARIAFMFFEAAGDSRGARMLIRLLMDPRIENRGAQRCASVTLINQLEAGRAAAEAGEEQAPAEWFTPLLIALLGNGLNTDHRLEPVLIGLRAELLSKLTATPQAPLAQSELDLAEAMARHGFRCEYVWAETPEETALIGGLQTQIERALTSGAPVSAASLYVLGAYRELARIDAVRRWVAATASQAPGALDPTLRMLVLEPMLEEEIAPTLPALTTIAEGVSSEVQAQYEANPYPRWSAVAQESPRPYLECIAAWPYPQMRDLEATAKAPKVLIAGCGTGQHPIGAARRYEGAQVLGVDLSRASLAYAARQAQQLGVANLAFAQADILRLEGLDATFDIVESSGVLHHMEDPEAGLRRLTAALKPGGFMNIGLYSRIARRHITAARKRIGETGYAADRAGLRQFRETVLSGQERELGLLLVNLDFYSASNLRDLVFHVQEHQFDLPQIKAMLTRNGLEFLRFGNLSPKVARAYRAANPQDANMTDLDAWAAFEEQNPHAFSAMYQFWCRKL